MGQKGLRYGEQGLSKGEVWAVDGANAQDPQGWKRPWGLWGVGLRLKDQKGLRCALHPWSQRAGDLTWEPSRLPGLEGGGKRPPLLSCSSSLSRPLPPASPDLFGPPAMPPKPMQARGRGGPWSAGDQLGSSAGSKGLSGWGYHPPLLSHSSQMAPPTCLS